MRIKHVRVFLCFDDALYNFLKNFIQFLEILPQHLLSKSI